MFLARRSLVPVVMATGMLLLLTVAGPTATKGDTIPLAEVGRDTPATVFRDPVGEHLYKLAFAPGEKMVAVGCYEQPVRLLDVTTGKELRRLNHLSIHGFAFSPDGKYLATADHYHDPDRISLWNPANGASLRPVKMEPGEAVHHIHFLDAGTLAAVTRNKQGVCVRLWDVNASKERRRFAVPDIGDAIGNLPWPCAFSADHKTFVTAVGRGVIHLFDVASGKEVKKLVAKKKAAVPGTILALVLSPDGSKLATAEQWSLTVPRGPAAPGAAMAPGPAFRRRPPPPWPRDANTTRHFVGISLWDLVNGQELSHWEAEAGYSLTFSPDGRTLASRGTSTLVLWETASGKERHRVTESRIWSGPKFAIFFQGGKKVVWNEGDGQGRVYDMTGVMRDGQARTVELTQLERDRLWDELAGGDASKAFRAVQALSAAPGQSVPLIRERLPRIQGSLDEKRLAQLLADLDDKRFAVREKAERELELFGSRAEPALRKVLSESPSLEVRRRIEKILPKLDGKIHPELLRVVRSLEVLENVGSAEAREVLQSLAKGDDLFGRATEAKRTLERLRSRAGRER